MTARRVIVVGGGIAGLAAAHRLLERARAAEGSSVVLLEATTRLGGTIATEHAGGFTIETGADSFITDKPWAVALCDRLGIRERLIGTRAGERQSYVVHAGRLHPLPDGFLLLAPTAVRAILSSRLFSWRGKLRMGLDLVLPRRRAATDESLAHFVRRRLGREAFERAAEPLAGGIYTGDAERLSLAATLPRFRDLERSHRSIILGLRAAARGQPAARRAGARYDLFLSHADGMGGLVADLARWLPEGVVRLRAPVEGLERDGTTWRVRVGGGGTLTADGIVLATPATVAASLLAPTDAALARELAAIEYASSATVTLGYRASDVSTALRGFGFVAPAVERRSLLACSYASRKFAGRAPTDHELVRAFLGGARRPDLARLPDEALIATVRAELHALLGIAAHPVLVRVHRHHDAMPQYVIGHLERVATIEARVAALPGLALAGAAYRGVGIPDCVRSGETAADAVV